ncbi:flagellar hook-length control protein FliK [Celeribacter arenosi]
MQNSVSNLPTLLPVTSSQGGTDSVAGKPPVAGTNDADMMAFASFLQDGQNRSTLNAGNGAENSGAQVLAGQFFPNQLPRESILKGASLLKMEAQIEPGVNPRQPTATDVAPLSVLARTSDNAEDTAQSHDLPAHQLRPETADVTAQTLMVNTIVAQPSAGLSTGTANLTDHRFSGEPDTGKAATAGQHERDRNPIATATTMHVGVTQQWGAETNHNHIASRADIVSGPAELATSTASGTVTSTDLASSETKISDTPVDLSSQKPSENAPAAGRNNAFFAQATSTGASVGMNQLNSTADTTSTQNARVALSPESNAVRDPQTQQPSVPQATARMGEATVSSAATQNPKSAELDPNPAARDRNARNESNPDRTAQTSKPTSVFEAAVAVSGAVPTHSRGPNASRFGKNGEDVAATVGPVSRSGSDGASIAAQTIEQGPITGSPVQDVTGQQTAIIGQGDELQTPFAEMIEPVTGERFETSASEKREPASLTALLKSPDLPPRIAAQLLQGARELADRPMEITLAPEELGKVRMTLQVGDNGAVHLLIAAERGETLDLMRRNTDLLMEQFRDLGVKDGGFSFQSFGGNSSNGEGGGDSRGDTPPTANIAAEISSPSEPLRVQLDGRTGIDIRV